MGVQFSTTGMVLRPALPNSLGSYSFTSPIAAVEYVDQGGEGGQSSGSYYSGSYTAMARGRWDLAIDFSLRHPGMRFEAKLRWLTYQHHPVRTGPAVAVVVAEAALTGTDLLRIAAATGMADADGFDFTVTLFH
jgi:hypothetical protein